jgi:hypothetical protein
MEFLKIIFLCIISAITYGIIHDQITARVCVEYFTIGHPPVFHTNSPTWLGLGWGVIATWWVGFFLGVPLAIVSSVGKRPQLTAKQLAPSILKLLCVMAIFALFAGVTGYLLVSHGTIQLPEFVVQAIPANKRIVFMADWFSHLTSYLVGFVGGIVVIVLAAIRRFHTSP